MGRAERRRAERMNRIEDRKDKILIPKDELRKSRQRLIDEANKYSTEYLMTCFALSLHRLYKFGPKRILRTLECVDGLMGQILTDEKSMDDFIKELDDKVGLKIVVDN